nr:heme exporter protein CcmB [Corticimicrobacter populi]
MKQALDFPAMQAGSNTYGGLFRAVLQRDLLLVWRNRMDAVTTLGFLVVVASLFPLGIGADPARLVAIGPGVIWVAALLSVLLSLPRLFAQDHDNGTLEQLSLSGEPAVLWVMAKLLAFWLGACLPVILAAPLLALWFQLPANAWPALLGGLLLGTPVLAMLGAIGAALTLGLRNGGMLLGLLVLPLYIPVLIFGAGAVEAVLSGVGARAHLLLLGGICAATLALAPWACAASLNIAMES